MNVHSSTTTIRLRADLRESLERAMKITRRSRSFLIMAALERHLEDIAREESEGAPKPRRLTRLLAIAGDGTSSDHVRSGDEINEHIRWLRDDE
jgi:predicted transcriptional regulator